MITIRWFIKIILITTILWGVISPSKETVSAHALNRTKVTKEEQLSWWLDARFGMMLTWGVYSQTGGIYTFANGPKEDWD